MYQSINEDRIKSHLNKANILNNQGETGMYFVSVLSTSINKRVSLQTTIS